MLFETREYNEDDEKSSEDEQFSSWDEASIRLWKPQVSHHTIKTKQGLHTLIDSEYPGLKRNPKFFELISDAELHLDVIKKFEDKATIQRREIILIIWQINNHKTYSANRQFVTGLVKDGKRPRLYWYIEQSVSKTEAKNRLAELKSENSGLRSLRDVEARLRTYYPYDGLSKATTHQNRLTQVEKYFRALEMLKEGGLFEDVAKLLEIHRSTVGHLFKGAKRPDLLQLARHVPSEFPGKGMRWIPKRITKDSFNPTDFIRVPNNVTDWQQVMNVVSQLKSIETNQMVFWEKKFGEMNQSDAVAYILGVLVGDAAKQSSLQSTDIKLRLSTRYSWSKEMGEGVCYALGKIGITTRQSAHPKYAFQWVTERTPITTWMMQSILGLKSEELTTYNPIKANWLLSTPRSVRLKFLQGLNDSDGFVSIKSQYMGIACGVNGDFTVNLLAAFGINSRYYKESFKVAIEEQESIKRACRLPSFQFAVGRQSKAEKLLGVLEARSDSRRKPVSKEIIQKIIELREQGLSYGAIAERIYDENHLSYHPTSISYQFRKHKSKDVEKTI
ncbi:MAG: hypothetical protein ACFFCF_09495 [Promethearchaeota archaeon]